MTQAMLQIPWALIHNGNGRGVSETGTGAVSGEVIFIDEFLDKVYGLAALGNLQEATDTIFETIDRLLLNGEFTLCSEILRGVDERRLPTALMRSFLTITAAAKDRLPARKALYAGVLSEMIRLKGDEIAQRLLGRLA